ncbi:MAG: outer membrane protein [bacterium]
MKKIIAGCLSFWLGLIAWAVGVTGQYVELRSGVCMPQERDGVHYKKAPCLSAEYGFSWDSWRLGLQIDYAKYKINRVEGATHQGRVFDLVMSENPRFTSISAMINLYYDWKLCEKAKLHVGCGLGMSRLNYRFGDKLGVMNQGNHKVYNQDKYLLVAQVMCGVAYDLNDHWSVSLGYRCMKMETVKYNTIHNADIWPSLKTPFLHSLEVGLRYNF